MNDTDWTPPAEVVSAFRAGMRRSWTDLDDGASETDRFAYALTAAYPAIVAEKDAEIERLRGAASDVERLTDTYTVEGTEIVLNRMHDLRRERDEAREKLAAVAALADEWQHAAYIVQQDAAPTPQNRADVELLAAAVSEVRAVLADHADTIAKHDDDARCERRTVHDPGPACRGGEGTDL